MNTLEEEVDMKEMRPVIPELIVDAQLSRTDLTSLHFRSSNESNTTTSGLSYSKLLKYSSLVLLTLQNASLALIMRYVRTRPGELFMTTTAVVASEVVKLFMCLVYIAVEQGGVHHMLRHLHENIIQQPLDCLMISLPAFIYMINNNLIYVAVSNLDVATYQVTYQLKILTTAVFAVIMLHKQLSRLQWFALILLFTGISIVQLQPEKAKEKTVVEQNWLLGMGSACLACIFSGFAGIFFEKMLKNTPQSLFVRNVQLSFIGIASGTVVILWKDWQSVSTKGFFHGYDSFVWCAVLLQSLGGIMVAVVVKYADNILKGFAASIAIIVSCIASIYMFNFQLSTQFSIGTMLVIVSVYMYSKFQLDVKIFTTAQK